MGHKLAVKTATKAKHKVSYAAGKMIHFKGPKTQTFKGKLKTSNKSYVLADSPVSHFHDAGGGLAYVAEPEARESAPEQMETDLASKLVDQIAEESNDVNELCESYGLRREELGRLTGFSLRALAEWASGSLPSQPAKRRLHEIRRLLDALAEIVKRESIPQWLHKPNDAFAPLTPLQVIELGEIDRLWAMVHDLASGQPG
jgi:DNA-binding transcriptional regulator YiaG